MIIIEIEIIVIIEIIIIILPVRFWECFWSNTPKQSKDTRIEK